MIYYQTGDLIYKPIDSIPKTAKAIKGGLIFKGRSGNNHAIQGSGFKILKDGEQVYLNLTKAATLTHEEHKAGKLPKGKYIVTHVLEQDHFNDLARPVVD